MISMTLYRALLFVPLALGGAALTAAFPANAADGSVTCPELSTPAPEKLRAQSQSYHNTLKQKATELCESDSHAQANRFYQNGAKQLANFLSENALTLTEECRAAIRDEPLLPLKNIPNLQNIFTLEENYNLCAAAVKPAATNVIAPPQTRHLSESLEEKSTRYESQKATIERIKAMNGVIPAEVRKQFNALEKELGIK